LRPRRPLPPRERRAVRRARCGGGTPAQCRARPCVGCCRAGTALSMPPPLSFLSSPAHRADPLPKAFAGPAAGAVIDLEAGLPVAEKENGRRTAARFIQDHPAHRAQLWLRIDSQELDADLSLAQEIDPVGVFIAKADVGAIAQTVTMLPGVSTIPLIESA